MKSASSAMPKKSKETDSTPLNQLSAMTVDQFCATHNVSRSKFYQLVQMNKAPKCFWCGNQRRISIEAATEWRRAMEMEATNAYQFSNRRTGRGSYSRIFDG
jgi:excisionase family DNA binding protein